MESDDKIDYLIRHAEKRGITEQKLLTVEHDHGEIVLELYRYFDKVATVSKLKLLCKIIGFEGSNWRELFPELVDFLKNETEFFKEYVKIKSEELLVSHKRVIDTEKNSVGKTFTKEQLKEFKYRLSVLKEIERDNKWEFKNAERQLKRYSKFLDTVNAFIDKYDFRSGLTSK